MGGIVLDVWDWRYSTCYERCIRMRSTGFDRPRNRYAWSATWPTKHAPCTRVRLTISCGVALPSLKDIYAVLPNASHGWEQGGTEMDKGRARKRGSTLAWVCSHAGHPVREGDPTRECLRRDSSRSSQGAEILRNIFRGRQDTTGSSSRGELRWALLYFVNRARKRRLP